MENPAISNLSPPRGVSLGIKKDLRMAHILFGGLLQVAQCSYSKLKNEMACDIVEGPLQAPLDDKDRTMLAFVMKAIKTPEAVAK